MSKRYQLVQIPHYRFLGFIFFATVLSWGAWGLVIQKLDPYSNPELALVLFYLSIFLAFTGTFTLIFFFIKKWKTDNEIYLKHLTISLRQGFLLSFCTTVCLLLLMLGLLRLWNGLLVAALVTLLEFYWSGKDELN